MSTSDAVARIATGLVVPGDLDRMPLHGEALRTHASRALEDAGVTVAVWPDDAQASGLPLVIHDAACPLVPSTFIRSAVSHCPDDGLLVAVRPVTDTIKRLDGEVVGETVDREQLLTVTAPVVLSPRVAAALERLPQHGLPVLVRDLRERFPVVFLEAPSIGRRVEDASAVLALEAFEELDAI